MVTITIFWKGDKVPTVKQGVQIEEGLTILTIQESETEYSRIMLHAIDYYDVEVE
jgi:hypothetical protein